MCETETVKLVVVAADAAGSASLVGHEAPGLLCPPRDRAAFTDATRRLALDPDLRRRLGASAREAATDYDWAEVLGRMVIYYRGAMGSTESEDISV